MFVDLPGISNVWSSTSEASIVDQVITEESSHLFVLLPDHIRYQYFDLPWNKLQSVVEKVDLPVLVASLGANVLPGEATDLGSRMPPEMVSCLRTLADRCTTLGVRGEFTADVLESIGIANVRVVGCPAYFEAGPGRRLGPPAWREGRGVVATGIVADPAATSDLFFVLQGEPPFTSLLIGTTPPQLDEVGPLFSPEMLPYVTTVLSAVANGRMAIFSDIPKWKETIAAAANMVVGTRVHGAFIGINSGVPAIITNADARARELCSLYGIPIRGGMILPELPWRELLESIDFGEIDRRYDGLFENYLLWLRENTIPVAPHDGGHAGFAPGRFPRVEAAEPGQRASVMALIDLLLQAAGRTAPTAPS